MTMLGITCEINSRWKYNTKQTEESKLEELKVLIFTPRLHVITYHPFTIAANTINCFKLFWYLTFI